MAFSSKLNSSESLLLCKIKIINGSILIISNLINFILWKTDRFFSLFSKINQYASPNFAKIVNKKWSKYGTTPFMYMMYSAMIHIRYRQHKRKENLCTRAPKKNVWLCHRSEEFFCFSECMHIWYINATMNTFSGREYPDKMRGTYVCIWVYKHYLYLYVEC